MRAILLVALLSTTSSLADGSALTTFQHEQEERARTEAAGLLQALCGRQCVLVAIEARVDEEAATAPTPGFERPEAVPTVPVLRSLRASVLADTALPEALRGRLEALVTQRLRGFGAPAKVTVETIAFPPLVEPTSAPVAATPPPQIIQLPPAPQPSPSPAPVTTPRLRDVLTAAAPMLLLGVLAALTALAIAWRITARRSVDRERRDAPFSPSPSNELRSGALADTLERERIVSISLRIGREPRLALRVVDEALRADETREVAAWLRAIGEPLATAIAGDPRVASHLPALSEALRVAPPAGDDDQNALTTFETRLTALQLQRPRDNDPLTMALHDATPEVVATASRRLDAPARARALARASASVQDAIWATTESAAERAELLDAVLATLDEGAAGPERARGPVNRNAAEADLLSALRAVTQENAVAALVQRLVLGMPRAEQDEVLTRLAARAHPLAGRLVTESALVLAPARVLEAAVLALPARTVATFLGATDADVRDAVLRATPRRIRAELELELAGRLTAGRDEVTRARAAWFEAFLRERAQAERVTAGADSGHEGSREVA